MASVRTKDLINLDDHELLVEMAKAEREASRRQLISSVAVLVIACIVAAAVLLIVPKVFTLCTPGSSVAMVVTEAGIALNPAHKRYEELKEDLAAAGIKTVTIDYLAELARSIVGTPKPIETTDRIVAVVEYRDGTVIDVIKQLKK